MERVENRWIKHIREYAKRNGVTYSCALSDPRCVEEYRNPKKEVKQETKQEVIEVKVDPTAFKEFQNKLIVQKIPFKQLLLEASAKDAKGRKRIKKVNK